MNNALTLKLAFRNIWNNKSTYFPFILTAILSIAIFYIIAFIGNNEGINEMRGKETIKTMMTFGIYIMGLFSLVFLFYTNSFLIKQRKQELGLYQIMGLTKKSVVQVIVYETLMIAFISIFLGMIIGVLFSKFAFMILLSILNFEVKLKLYLSSEALKLTLVLFSLLFLLILIYNSIQVKFSKPINLLKAEQFGERQPKSNTWIGFIGLLLLIIGYGIALRVEDPRDSIGYFSIAVILVILGSYSLFTSISIIVLKKLRENAKLYYTPKNFISISGMIYRMKQNAVGLANICILSTMVIVTGIMTTSLYFGLIDLAKDSVNLQNFGVYGDLTVTFFADNSIEDKYINLFVSESDGIKINEQKTLKSKWLIAFVNDSEITISETGTTPDSVDLRFVPLDYFNQVTNQNIVLERNQILISEESDLDSRITINDVEYEVVNRFKNDFFLPAKADSDSYIVVKDTDVIESFLPFVGNDITYSYTSYLDLDANDGQIADFQNRLSSAARNISNYSFRTSSRQSVKDVLITAYGSFMFLGLIFALIFTMTTGLIIYYKQVSEGYQDRVNFTIMKKVGLSTKEVKSTIRGQILWVFYLPLAVSIIHIAFASKMMLKMLEQFGIENLNLFIICSLGTILIYALVYGGIYLLASKKYDKLVNS